ncbi:MAG: hypothetical protein JWO82_1446 [Akkermansiaceae bacterium]|nr:hypothetical protein [Akkermansiaceae bacterium]
MIRHSSTLAFLLVLAPIQGIQAQSANQVVPIRVTVTGQMLKPGSCELPYLFNPQDLKKVCGGPTEFGDLSNIIILRFARVEGVRSDWNKLPAKDEIIRVAKAGKGAPVTLQFGDVIYVPCKKINAS